MEKKSIFLAVTILVVVCFVIPAEAGIQPSFQGLGDLPGGDFCSIAYAVSADGLVVVGESDSASSGPYVAYGEAFRWENGEMVGLGYLPGGGYYSSARSVSADGSVIVGGSSSVLGCEAFRWENGEMVGLGSLSGGDYYRYSYANGVSADGSVIVGVSQSPSGWEAFRWTQTTGMVGLGDLPGSRFWSEARGISADGSVIVGESESAASGDDGEAFRWTPETGMVGLGDLPGGRFYSLAYSTSADGSVIVGTGYSALGYEAFRWEDSQMVGLGGLPGGNPYSQAYGVSADGSVIVGYGISTSSLEAFIWDMDNGMRSLKDVLVNDCGLDLTGWMLCEATGISADGLTIVGYGENPYGYTEGWIATIPEPGTMALLGIGLLFLRKRQEGR